MGDFVQTILGFVMEHALTLLVPFVAAVLVRVFQKVGVSLNEERRAHLESALLRGALWAEEWAERKRKETGEKVPGSEKMRKAIEKGLSFVVGKIPRIDHQEAADIINAGLPQIGAGAAASAAALGKALRTPK
jgi:hypothetical protein